MHAFAFRADDKITDVLRKGFTLSAEIIPPRNGAEQSQILSQIDRLVQAGSQFLAVTRGAGGSLRGGSLPIAQAIKEQFRVPAIAHFTCRDLSPHEIENQLIDHHYFGIRNILGLRGDPPDGAAAAWQPREGCYRYAHQLIRQIRALNDGQFLKREGGPAPTGNERTDFCIGAAAYPEHPDEVERIEFFRQKVEAGAEYAITDVLFDAEAYARFLDGCGSRGVRVPILPGTRLLRSQAGADRMMKKFRVKVPSSIYARLPEKDAKTPESLAIGLEIFHEFVAKIRHYGAPGIHVFVIVDLEGSEKAIQSLRQPS